MKILVHGGAGTIKDEERQKLAASESQKAANIGYESLVNGGTAVDAVTEAVKKMENHPHFNAGKGSVLTEDGTLEMDAMLVNGNTGKIGGVIGVGQIANPIILSRKIMENSKHMIFFGSGAESLAEDYGIKLIDQKDLITDRSKERLKRYQDKREQDSVDPEGRDKYGTVGAVAIDDNGGIAAATSTGGTLGKQIGRVGDTPLFGAGTYATQDIAISGTGVGEYIIQGMLGTRIANHANNLSIKEATKKSLEEMSRFGSAGVISMDKEGNWYPGFTTPIMVWAYRDENIKTNYLEKEV